MTSGLRALAGPLVALDTGGLERCVHCRRDRVTRIDSAHEGEDHQRLTLRCGECGEWRHVVATNAQVAAFEATLTRQERAIARALARLEGERMADELETFVRALSRDLIDATDFAG